MERDRMGSRYGGRNQLNIGAALLAFLTVLCFPQMWNLRENMIGYTNSIFSVLLFLFCFFAIRYAMKGLDLRDRRGILASGLWSFFFVGAMLFGTSLEKTGNVNFKNALLWLAWPVLTCFFGLLVCFAMQRLAYGSTNKKKAGTDGIWQFISRHEKTIAFLLMLLAWLPVFLAVYPGFFVYDAQEEYVQVAARRFSTHHPLTHVILLGGIVRGIHKLTGSYNLGIACYIIIQMIVSALVFTAVLAYLKKRGVSGRLRMAAALFYACFPTVVMFVLCSAKDTYFTLGMLGLLICLLHFEYAPEEFLHSFAWRFCFYVSAVCMLLFRKNGIYAFILLIPILLWRHRNYWKKTVLLLMIVLLTAVAVDWTLAAVLHADRTESQEILTVPIQQLARTYKLNRNTFTEAELETLYEILPETALDRYNPKLSDPVKIKFKNEIFRADPGKYLRLWIRAGLRTPLTYLNAWLENSYGYWYPDTVIDVYRGNDVFTFTYDDNSYFGYEVEQPGERESKNPAILEWYRKLSLEIYKEKIPVVSMLFSPAFLFWLFSFMSCYLWYRKRYASLMPNLLIWFLYLTVLFGPTYLPRYVLIFWFGLPMFAALLKEDI